MKKSLIFFWITILLTGAVYFCSFWSVLAEEQNMVIIKETAVKGNPEAAEGFSLFWRTECYQKLLLDTLYTIGKTPIQENNAEYFHDGFENPVYISPEGFLYVNVLVDYDYSMKQLDDINRSLSCTNFSDIIEKTPVGGEYSEERFLTEEFCYYPTEIEYYNSPAINDLYTELWISSFTLHPVNPNHKVMVTVRKNLWGEVEYMGYRTTNEKYECSYSMTVSPDGMYALIGKNCFDDVIGTQNTQTFPPGVYYAPVSLQQMYGFVVDFNNMVCLESFEGGRIEGGIDSISGRKVFFHTENADLMMTVLDKHIYQVKIKENVGICKVMSVKLKEDSFLIIFDNNEFLFGVLEDEKMVLSIRGILEESEEPESWKLMDYAYDGKRLAMVHFCSLYGNNDAELLVYEDGNLTYQGKYEYTLGKIVGEPERENVRMEQYNNVRFYKDGLQIISP